jgi:hypothetical protein
VAIPLALLSGQIRPLLIGVVNRSCSQKFKGCLGSNPVFMTSAALLASDFAFAKSVMPK